MPRYAELIYNGFWFAPEREMLQALIDKSQEHVEGEVRLKLYKGNVIVTGRESPQFALRLGPRHLRGRPRRLRPEGRRRLHQAQCAPPAHAGPAPPQARQELGVSPFRPDRPDSYWYPRHGRAYHDPRHRRSPHQRAVRQPADCHVRAPSSVAGRSCARAMVRPLDPRAAPDRVLRCRCGCGAGCRRRHDPQGPHCDRRRDRGLDGARATAGRRGGRAHAAGGAGRAVSDRSVIATASGAPCADRREGCGRASAGGAGPGSATHRRSRRRRPGSRR